MGIIDGLIGFGKGLCGRLTTDGLSDIGPENGLSPSKHHNLGEFRDFFILDFSLNLPF